ncbi:hypothetical protein ABW19_dt0209096 [Dactylella cylindrospora]|nr:hypothetical protein ABW19_dt0209096 [Dactylella cylindrospora]
MATLVQSTTTNSFQPQPVVPTTASQSLNNMTFNTQPHNNFQRNMSFPQAQPTGSVMGGYRGIATAPVAPYAFKSTPNLTTNDPKFQPNKQDVRASSGFDSQPRQRQPTPHSNLAVQQLPMSLPRPNASQPSQAAGARPSADRYRRNVRRSESFGPHGNDLQMPVEGMSNMSIYSHPGKASSSPSLPLSVSTNGFVPSSGSGNRPYSEALAVGPGTGIGVKPIYVTGDARTFSKDDSAAMRQSNGRTALQQKELMDRRRSIGAFDLNTQVGHSAGGLHNGNPFMFNQPNFFQPTPPRSPATENSSPATFTSPVNSFHRRESSDSISSKNSSNGSQPSKAKQQLPTPAASPATKSSPPNELSAPSPRAPEPKKRSTNPSPLSKPVTMSPDPNMHEEPKEAEPEITPVRPRTGNSAAADRLAALQAESRKGFKSRLRRAFSFGSAAELKQAASMTAEERQRLRQEREEAEQQKIAERQEAGGLGNSIYSNNQGGIFSGSTDNLSISSTASSASVMLRKMGKGMKRGSRNFVGLFRPKSVVGVPAASGPVSPPPNIEPAMAQVSMVTVEAERERVNVNASPLEHAGGGTGFPKLERNSLDAGRQEPSSSGDTSSSRRSIVGGEKERAEVLAAVKKGILKRSGSSSPVVKPTTELPVDFQLPQIPLIASQPTTPDVPDEKKDANGDYFLTPTTAPKYTVPKSPSSSAISAPVTNQEVAKAKASVSFSQKLTFYDTWTSGEYDRRGEISTCNKLTPALAQQIKEELNSFKMEMEVHENSRVYTHFF